MRRLELEPPVFHADELLGGLVDWRDRMEAAGVLRKMAASASASCPYCCDDNSVRRVTFLDDRRTGGKRGYISAQLDVLGTIVVDKVTVPGGDPQSFAFIVGGAGYINFNLTDAADPNRQNLVAGTYSVTEIVPSGWNLTNTTCVSSIGDTETAGAIELDSGETVTCTFMNTKRGTIVVDKVTVPAGELQSFAFTTTGEGYTGFSLTDADAPNSQSLAPGAYSVAETVPAGWDLTNTTCVSSIGDNETAGAIELDASETSKYG